MAKAVRELEREGLLITRVGKGSFVNDSAPDVTRRDRDDKAGDLAKGYGKDMRWLGYNRDNSAELVKEKWEDDD